MTYMGDYPVPDKQAAQMLADGDEVRFRYRMDLEDIYSCDGVEGMNDYLDALLRMRRAILTDITYSVVGHSNDGSVILVASGYLEPM